MKALINKVTQWANDRNLIEGSNAASQFLKLTEELQEVNSANCDYNLISEIGDYMVVSIIMLEQLKIEDWFDYRATFPSLDWIDLMGDIATDIAKGRCAKNSIIAGMNCIYDYLPEGVTPECALHIAYRKIEHRKGRMINNVFVKEGDL